MLPDEPRRERVVTMDEVAKYLATAPEPLAAIAAVRVDTRVRPEECFRLCWEAITWVKGRHGTVFMTRGNGSSPACSTNDTEGESDPRRPLGGWREAR